MFFNYLNAAGRFFKKNWPLTTLNVVVFGIGIATCMLILQKVTYEFSYDKFNVNHESIYRVSLDHYYPHDVYQSSTASSFYPIGSELKNQYPEIKEFTRVSSKRRNSAIRVGDNSFQEDNVHVINPSFFKVFTVEMIHGDTSNIGAYDIFISESLAAKLYGEDNPVGSSIDLWGGNLLKVKGVYKDVPNNSHLKYDLLLVVLHNRERMADWQYYNLHTYIVLHDGVNGSDIEKKLTPFNEKFSKLSDQQSDVEYRWEIKLQPLTSIYLESDVDFEHEINGDLQSVYLLMVMGFLIIIISCFNYVNLTNSMYAKRFSEFFIRKIHGATSVTLLKQYAFESFILLFTGFMVGILIIFLLPYISDYAINLRSQTESFYWGIIGIVMMSFILSVILPASAFSMIDPLKFAKGDYASNSFIKGLGKSLIVVQFVISFMLIAGSLTVNRQLDFIIKKNPGINISDVVTLDFPGLFYPRYEGDLSKLRDDLEKHVGIQSVSFSAAAPGTKLSIDGSIRFIDDPVENAKLNYLQIVSSGYFNTYEIEVLEGRVFDERRLADSLAILINESMAKELNVKDYSSLIGKKVTMPWNDGYPIFEIVGVVKDYYHESLKSKILPCAFLSMKSGGWCNKASIRLSSMDNENRTAALEIIEATYSNLFSESFQLSYVDKNYSGQFDSYFDLSNLIRALALLAIMMAGVGLFGLASNETAKRSKEVAIRKINGAQAKDIYIIFLKYFLKLIGIAFIISLPVSFYFANDWLNNFAVRVEMGAWFVGLQVLITASVGLLSISYYLIKTTSQNPIIALRNRE